MSLKVHSLLPTVRLTFVSGRKQQEKFFSKSFLIIWIGVQIINAPSGEHGT